MSMESGQLGGNGSVPSNNAKSRRPDLALLEKAVPQRPLLGTQEGNAPWEGQSGGSRGCEQAPHNRIQAWHTGFVLELVVCRKPENIPTLELKFRVAFSSLIKVSATEGLSIFLPPWIPFVSWKRVLSRSLETHGAPLPP